MSTLFLGTTYWTDGNIVISIPVTVVLSALFFILVNFFIKEKRNIAKGGYKPQTIVLFFVYIALAIPASLISIHAINVELFEKETIKKISKERIAGLYELDQMYDDSVDRIVMRWETNLATYMNGYIDYTGRVKREARDSLSQFPYNITVATLDDIKQQGTKSSYIKKRVDDWKGMFQESKEQITYKQGKIISENTKALKNWNRFMINQKFNKLDQYLTSKKLKMEEAMIDQTRLQYNFDITPYKEKKVLLNQPVQLFLKHLNPISFVIVLLMQFLILLPYFLTKKPKYGNKPSIFKKSKTKKSTKNKTYDSGDEITGTSI